MLPHLLIDLDSSQSEILVVILRFDSNAGHTQRWASNEEFEIGSVLFSMSLSVNEDLKWTRGEDSDELE